jgi:hypothetical protein
MAMMVPRPSYPGNLFAKESEPVSFLGCRDHSGKGVAAEHGSQSMTDAIDASPMADVDATVGNWLIMAHSE